VIESGKQASEAWACDIGVPIADNLHPVGNPAIDALGNIYTTFSGSRGQKVPVAVFKIDLNFSMKPFLNDLMNATGLALDAEGLLYISSRYDGFIYQAAPSGNMTVYVEGMGVATGIAFDRQRNLYVGDRSGTIFKINPERQVFVFATIEPSIAAYHLAFGPDGYLYVTGPTTSSFDCVYRVSITARWKCSIAAWAGRRAGFRRKRQPVRGGFDRRRKGVVRVTPEHEAELFVSGPGIVGLAFAPSRALVVSTTMRSTASTLASRVCLFLMNAEIIAAGSELLTAERVDTNSLYLTAELNNLGVEVTAKAVIGDDRDALAEAVRAALSRSAIVILSGGLGRPKTMSRAKRWHWRSIASWSSTRKSPRRSKRASRV